MSTMKCAWLALLIAAAGLLSSPHPSYADRKPSKSAEQRFDESDPWRPDSGDPDRAQYSPMETAVEPEETTIRRDTERAWLDAWYRILHRILSLWSGGILR